MPNLENFSTDTTILSNQYTKYTVSRVVANKQDDLLEMEVPAEFPDEILKSNIEVMIYSLFDNSLVGAFVVDDYNAINVVTLQYEDNSLRKLLYIDFSKIFTSYVDAAEVIPAGRYSVTLNFFSDEVGSYDNRNLKISTISTARREVELKLKDTTPEQIKILKTFATPSIPVEYIEPVLIQIFNQENANEVFVPSSNVKIDSGSLYQNFENRSGQLLLQYDFDDDNGTQLGINTIVQNVLNIAYPIAKDSIENLITTSGSKVITEAELSQYVEEAIEQAYDDILDDVEKNPLKYRFDLI